MQTWEKKPVLLLVLATAAILVGTLVTMALPFVWVNTESDKIAAVKPYTVLQLVGRDVYIREGCNNCHTQTVRPLPADALRYGPPSKSGEFVYDRPFLWGSRRMGPDLARVGGKYPDVWHVNHLISPQAVVAASNMPAYAFLKANPIDAPYTQKKMDVLHFPYTPADIQGLQGKTELDGLVAYLQKLGSDIGWRKAAAAAATIPADAKNPFADSAEAIKEGAELYAKSCAECHKADRSGDVGPDLTHEEEKTPAELFKVIKNGDPDGGMPAFNSLGDEKIWKLVAFVQSKMK